MMMGLPSINISFKTAAVELSARAGRGSVGLIIRDSNTGAKGAHVLKKSNETIPLTIDNENKKYIYRAFIGYAMPPSKVVCYILGTDAEDLKEGLDYFSKNEVDYLCGPATCTAAESKEICDWIKIKRGDGYTVKAVLPNEAGDYEGIINFTTEDINAAGEALTTAQFCSRIAGSIAGTSTEASCTFAPLPEVTSFKMLSNSESGSRINSGELILYNDGIKTKIARGVNSLQTTTVEKGEIFKKIKIVSAVDMIKKDITRLIQDNYIGKVPNDYDHKCVLITALDEYLKELEFAGILEKGTSVVDIDIEGQKLWLSDNNIDTLHMTDTQIKKYTTGDEVYLKVKIKPLDAIESATIAVAC